MRVKVAIGFVLVFLAALLSVGPASAGVRVIERSNGDVLINGDGSANFVHVIFCGEGAAVVIHGPTGDEPDGIEFIVVADDLTINLKGGNDRLIVGHGDRRIRAAVLSATTTIPTTTTAPTTTTTAPTLPEECFEEMEASGDHDEEEEPDVPGNLKIVGASGNDTVNIDDVSVGKDLTVLLSSGDNSLYTNYVHVGHDVTVRASGGRDDLEMYGFWIHDRLDVNLSAGNNDFYFAHGSTARAIIRGHNGDDSVRTGSSEPIDLGRNPIVITAGGADEIRLNHIAWTGKARVNSGGGGDTMILDPYLPRGVLDVDTGSGNDSAIVIGPIGPGDDFNGGPGDDEIQYDFARQFGATIKNFETETDIGEPPPRPPPTTTTTTAPTTTTTAPTTTTLIPCSSTTTNPGGPTVPCATTTTVPP